VHPKAETVHGEKGYATLGAKAIWLQLGVIDQDSVNRAEAAGLIAVMDRCPAIEYGKR
jgi:hypothetical protein